jgi:hypothetical protein
MSLLNNSMSYQEYINNFNTVVTDFRQTSVGPVAKAEGVWYSVNGTRGDIMDVRHRLSDAELARLGLSTGN